MVQKRDKPAALPGVFSTLAAGFELTTRYLWLMVIPAALDLFLWIGPRLSFRPLIETLLGQLPAGSLQLFPAGLVESLTSINFFTYLSVVFLGVPALMRGTAPAVTPIQLAIIERAGLGEWAGALALLTLAGLLLTALYYGLIAYALRRMAAVVMKTAAPFDLFRFARRAGRTWFRLAGLTGLFLVLTLIIFLPFSLLAGFLALISQTVALLVMMGALVFIIWVVMFFSYTPQGMTLNPRAFLPALVESVRLFRHNLPASLGLLVVVTIARQLLDTILLTADSGTWVTGINLLAHAYISTALIVALFIFYRDRYAAFLQAAPLNPPGPPPPATPQEQP